MDARPSVGPRHAGVDWSWDRQAVCVIDEEGAVLDRFDVKHQAREFTAMTERLRRWGVERVAIERPDGPVVQALLDADVPVVVISPRQVRAFRLRHGTAGNKDDRFDAYVLADAVRTDGHRMGSLVPDRDDTRALRALVRARKDLVGHRIAVHNQLLANLQHAFPGAVGLFAQLDSPISLTFLERFPTVDKAAWLSERRLQAWLRSVGYCGNKTPASLIAHLREAPVGLEEEAGVGHAVVTIQLVGLQRTIRVQIDELDHRIAEALNLHPDGDIFRSLPRAGTNRAALLLAEIGDRRGRFPDEASLAAAAGVAPSTRASGKRHSVSFRRGCDKHLRSALVDFAQDSVKASPWARDIYDRARSRGCRHPHAVRIVARAWVRVIWRCWTQGVPYDPTIHGGLNKLEAA
ncbi:MAG: IS110 family transposase [Actinobacteria bacterium]|nr:MAG: IS110 family transposase [Actinomycetota bacterium]